ncbi:MAG: hypothetical protein ABIW79_11160, partial [Gemmatimonas sp.]
AQLTFNGRSVKPAISPDGKHMAYAERRCPLGEFYACHWSLLTVERGTSRPVTILDSAIFVDVPRFSNDGQVVFVNVTLDASRTGLYAVPRLGGVPRRITDYQSFDFDASGDTVVVGPYFETGRFARLLLAATGKVVDSVPLPQVDIGDIAWSPNGEHFVVSTDYVRLTVLARDGTVTDSVLATFRPYVRWLPDGSGFLVFRALEGSEDDLDFYPVSREGRLGKRQVILPKIPTLTSGEFDLARGARTLVVATGSATYDMWTFDLAGKAWQRTSGTTWYGRPSISPDGGTLYYMRGDATGDNLYRLTLPTHEEALTADSVPSGFAETVVSRDGRRVAFGMSMAGGSRTGLLDVASRQSVYEVTRADRQAPIPIRSRGVVYALPNGRGLLVADSLGDAGRQWLVPDSMTLVAFDVGSGDSSVAILVHSAKTGWIASSPLGQFEPRTLYRFQDNEIPGRQLSWSDDGWISFEMTRGSEAPALWGVRANGGRLEQRAALPSPCNSRWTRVANAAPMAVCVSANIRPDIWVIDLPWLRR